MICSSMVSAPPFRAVYTLPSTGVCGAVSTRSSLSGTDPSSTLSGADAAKRPELPGAHAADVPGLDRLELAEAVARGVRQTLVQSVAHDDLVALGHAVEARGEVDRVGDRAHVRTAERTEGQHLQLPDRHRDVNPGGALDLVDVTLPLVGDRSPD